jgi:hypothetical protein
VVRPGEAGTDSGARDYPPVNVLTKTVRVQTRKAALGSAAFFVLAPGGVAALPLWLLTGWTPRCRPWRPS